VAISIPFRRSRALTGAVGLDVDSGFVAVAQLDGRRMVQGASAALEPDVVGEGEVRDVERLSASLKELFKGRALPTKVRLGVANQQIVVRQFDMPKIEDPEQLRAAVRFQAADALPMPVDEAVLDHQVVGTFTNPEGSERLQVVVVAAREAMVRSLVAAARGAGLKPEAIDLGAFALVRALAGEDADAEKARVFCHLAGVANMAVALGSVCVFTRTVPVPEGYDGVDAASLAEQIRPSIDFYMSQPDARWVGDVVLSGPRSGQEELAEQVSEALALPVSVAEPLPGLDVEGLSEGEDPHRYTVASGLAMGGVA